MAQRWVTEEELNLMQNQYADGGNVQESNPLMEFYNQLPPELQEKIQLLPSEKQQEVLMQLMQKYQEQGQQQFQEGGEVDPQQIMQMVAQALQQGMQPEEVVQMLVEQGIPQEQAMQIIQQVMQSIQEQPQQEQQFLDGGDIKNNNVVFSNIEDYNSYKDSIFNKMEKPVTNNINNDITKEELALLKQGATQFNDNVILDVIGKKLSIIGRGLTNTIFKTKFAMGGKTQGIPVEAERNENITVQDGQQPQVDGGYLEQQSHNPITGQSTYEIPDNGHSETHDNGGVNMQLSEGDVVNSDKTKIPIDFKIYGKSFKNKTFKDASDYLSKQETKIQDDFAKKVKEGKTDKVSDGALQIMLAKLGKNRNELNELQEQILESKKQKEHNILMDDQVAKYGKIVLEVNKAKEGLNVTMDRYLNYKISERPVLKAADGVKASVDKFSKFADSVMSNPKASLEDIMGAYKQSGLMSSPSDNTSIYKPTFNPINGSKIVGDFKSLIAREETGGWSNPYIAIAGVSEKEAAVKSFKELQAKAASSAIGKYQFVWNIHKNDISRVTGVKDPDSFRNNPQAQEKFMDWFRDTQLLPQATQLKQRYQLPLSIEKVMAMIHLEGKAGLEKKIKSGTLKASTMANNFKNASPLNYASNFAEGGKVYADKGNNISAYTQGDRSGLNKADYSTGDLQHIAKTYFPNQTFNSNAELQQTMLDYFIKNFGGYEDYVIPTPKGTKTGVAKPRSLVDNIFGDDWSNAIKFFTKPDTSVSVPAPMFKIDPYKNKQVISLPNNEQINIDLPSVNDDTYLDDKDDLNRNKRNNSPSEVDNSEQKEVVKDLANKSDKTSWRDRLNYGMREALPYLNNLGLLMEGRIMPTFQQKPYQNPYDNLSTDVNIQSALNDIDRNTLTAMSDERGNPSVRNARMSQIYANSIAGKAPLYSQKYNEEQQLTNNKVLGQGQYLNNWTDTNMNLRKRYEQEVLQTIENQRQQQHMAIDNMINNYLRKQEENQNLNLSLLETNYDFNPVTGKYVFNKDKAEKNFKQQKFLSNNKLSDNSKIKTIGNHQYVMKKNGNLECIDCDTPKSEDKYGLKVKKS